jgi:hypothetical protein
VIFLHGVIQPDSGWQWAQQRAVARIGHRGRRHHSSAEAGLRLDGGDRLAVAAHRWRRRAETEAGMNPFLTRYSMALR